MPIGDLLLKFVEQPSSR